MAGGLGLGLKSLVELHGGSVAARSDGPGTGTELIVRLPDCSDDCRTIEPPGSPGAPLAPPPSTRKRSVCCAESNCHFLGTALALPSSVDPDARVAFAG